MNLFETSDRVGGIWTAAIIYGFVNEIKLLR